jgi:UrcA family protein
MRVSILIIAIAFVLTTYRVAAHDGASAGVTAKNRVVVYFGDFNLTAEQDAKEMLRRIQRAARKACGGQHTFSSYTGGVDNTFDECRDAAIRRAVEQLNAPVVKRIYSERDKQRSGG